MFSFFDIFFPDDIFPPTSRAKRLHTMMQHVGLNQPVLSTSSASSVSLELPSAIKSSRKKHHTSPAVTISKAPKKASKNRYTLDPVFDKVAQDYLIQCCTSRCTWEFPLNTVISFHTWYNNMPERQALEWLSNMCVTWWIPSVQGGMILQPRVHSHIVCEEALCKLYGFSKAKLNAAKTKNPSFSGISEASLNQHAAKSVMQDNMFMWLTDFFESFGDHMPNSDQIHMPTYCTKRRLYVTYCEEMINNNTPRRNIGSETSFRDFINSKFSNVRFPRKTRLARCDFCTSINSRRLKCQTEEQKKLLKDEIQLHMKITSEERQMYHHRRTLAQRHPDKIASIIIDASEKIRIPNIVPIPKQLARANILELGISGVICHNTERKHILLTFPDFPKGADTNISMVFWQLSDMLSSYNSVSNHPSILFVQMDNGSENKNRWMFGFLSMLVFWKWFDEINLFFLQPGHTHEDIDQLFSTISMHLDCTTIGSYPSLLSSLPKSWKNITPPSISTIPAYMNWSGWMSPHLKDFSGHGSCYAFIFRTKVNGKPGMKMKTLASFPHWQGLSHDPDNWIELFTSIPQGQPVLIFPQPVDAPLISDLHKFGDWISVEENNWLQKFQSDRKLSPPLHTPENWSNFQRFELSPISSTQQLSVQTLVGNGPDSFKIQGDNSIRHITPGSVTLQTSAFLRGQFIALRPSRSSFDEFWLAQIVEVDFSQIDVKYKLHYWERRQDNVNIWKSLKGNGAYGDACHSAIIFGPVTMTYNNHISATSMKHIHEHLKKE
jgi:hypothetical protein